MDERQPADDIAAQGAPASPDALRTIVAKHQRTRTRTLGVALAVALVAGPVAGWAIGHGGGGGQQVATGSGIDRSNTPAAANAPAGALSGGASSSAVAYPGGNPPKVTHLFNRTSSDGIAIRAYRQDPPPPPSDTTSTTTPSAKTQPAPCPMPMTVKPGAPPGSGSSEGGQVNSSGPAPDGKPGTAIAGTPPPEGPTCPPPCNPTPSVLAEASNDAAVDQSFDPIDAKQPSEPLSHVLATGFGVPEGSPTMIVTVQTGPGVATVRLRLPSGATDQMAPVGNVAVLAHASDMPPPAGTVVEALDASGKVLASQDLTQQDHKPMVACGGVAGPMRAYQAPAQTAPPTPPTTR